MKPDPRVPGAGDFPRRITLELTNRCNLNCTFCPRRMMERHQGFLEKKLAKRFIEEAASHLPVTLVPFFRGEPLLHPDWIELLSYARNKGLGPIQFTTNATLLDENATAALIDLDLDFISFSMDTVDPRLYEQTRRGSDYKQVLANVLRFIQKKEETGKCKPVIQVSAVETPLHRPGMDAFVSFWQPKVDRVRTYVEHSADGHPGSISEPLPLFSNRLACWKPFSDLVICWDGTVALCNHDWVRDPTQQIGRVGKQSIAEVWHSKAYRRIRSAHQRGDLSRLSPCDNCDHWKMYYLPEGCLGKTYLKA